MQEKLCICVSFSTKIARYLLSRNAGCLVMRLNVLPVIWLS